MKRKNFGAWSDKKAWQKAFISKFLLFLTITALALPVVKQSIRLNALSQKDDALTSWSQRTGAGYSPLRELPSIQDSQSQVLTAGPLVVHPTNPRYFSDGSGRAILLVGSHTWANFQDSAANDPPTPFNYTAYLDFMVAHNHNFMRFWAWEQTKWGGWYSGDMYFTPSMYQRTGPGMALDGKPKFNLTLFNQAYFDRMRQRIIEAGQRGIYVSIMLFDGWSIEDKDYGGLNPWLAHPYHAANNVNGINGDLNNDNEGHEIHTLAIPAVTALQQQYVQMVIDTVNDLDNVLYEISNESHGSSQNWQYHMINFINAYQATKPKQHPVGMTVEWPNGSNSDLFNSPAVWISPNPEGGYMDNPPASTGNKIIINDTDHLWGIGGNRGWAWKSFLRGLHVIFMDPYNCSPVWPPNPCNPNNAEWVSLRQNMGYMLSYANRMNLAAMTPQNSLSSTGYCLANAVASGAEYLVYAPTGGTIQVNLSAASGTLNVEWLNPATGAVTVGNPVQGGATRSLTPPFSGDAVLYIFAPGANPTPSATPANTPTSTPFPTNTPMPTASNTPVNTVTNTPTATPTTPGSTNTPTATATAGNSPTPSATASSVPTHTPTATGTPGSGQTPSATPASTNTSTPTATGTLPAETPTGTPTATATATPVTMTYRSFLPVVVR